MSLKNTTQKPDQYVKTRTIDWFHSSINQDLSRGNVYRAVTVFLILFCHKVLV